MYQEIGSSDEAIVELSKVLALEPGNAVAHLYIGLAYRDKEFYQEARNHLEKVLELGGDAAAAYAGLASVFLMRRRFEDALDLTRKSTRIKANYLPAHLIMGNIYQAMGNDEIALLKYEKVLSLDPQSREGHFRTAISCRNLERFDDAIYELRRTLEIDPDYVPAHLELGEIYEKRGDGARAIAQFESIIALSRDNPDLCRKIGRAYHAAGKLDIAVRYFERLHSLLPEDPGAKELLGACMRDLGRLEEAVALFEDVIKASPNSASAYQGLAGVYCAMGDSEKEVFFLRKAIKSDPRCVEALHSLGRSYLSRMLAEEAAFVFRKCIRVAPEDPRGYELLGRLEHQLSHLDTAIYQYQKAASLGSRSAELYYNLGQAYLRKGSGLVFKNSLYLDMAKRCFVEAIELDKGLRKAPGQLRPYLYRLADEDRLLPAGRFITSVTQRFDLTTKRFSLFTDSVVIVTSFLGFKRRRSYPLAVISPDHTVQKRSLSLATLLGLGALILLLALPALGIAPSSPPLTVGAAALAAIALTAMFMRFQRYVFHDRYSHQPLFEYRPDSPGADEAQAFLDRMKRRLARRARTTV